MIRTLVALLSLILAVAPAFAEKQELTAAMSLDIPPYVMEGATRGLEVDIMRLALPDHALRFAQMPYADLQKAVQKRRADVSVGVRRTDDERVFYSRPFITFENVAVSKKSDRLDIRGITDLGEHRVLTWQGADRELGDTFQRLFAPESPHHANYVEVPNQEDQVRRFWDHPGSVAVIDRSIFMYFTKELGRSMDEVDLHRLFPPATAFRVAFKEAALRDTFDRSLTEMCQTGEYEALLERYDVVLRKSVCDMR